MPDEDILHQLRQAGGIRGKWRSPETPDETIRGTLLLTGNGRMELTIDRDVNPVESLGSILSFRSESIPLLIGLLNEGTFCTLKGLVQTSTLPYSFSAQVLSPVFSVQYALLGAQIGNLAEFRVRDVSVSLPVLMDWSNVACCSASFQQEKFLMEAKYRQTLPFGDYGDFAASIHINALCSMSGMRSQVPSVTPGAEIEVAFSDQPLFESVTRLIPLILNFFSLATLSDVRVSSFSCTSESAKQMRSTDKGDKPNYPEIVVYRRALPQDLAYDGLSATSMFFTYEDLNELNALDAFAKILTRYQEFDLLLPLLVPESGDFHLYSGQRLLNAAQSLEYVDRMLGDNAVLPVDVFEVRKKEMLDTVQNPTRKWILDTWDLLHANEPSFRRRVKNIIGQNAKLLDTTVRRQKGFVDSVVKTRNYLVHLDSEAKKEATLDIGLINLTDKAEALARISFLRVIGFSEEDLGKLFSHNERSYIRHLTDIFRKSDYVIKDDALAEDDDTSSN
jgi:hypothetical protein